VWVCVHCVRGKGDESSVRLWSWTRGWSEGCAASGGQMSEGRELRVSGDGRQCVPRSGEMCGSKLSAGSGCIG
jgi:hypothetical protein